MTSRAWVPPVVVAAITLIVGLSIVNTLPVGVFYDDGMYVILAKSLATGHGLRWLQVPGQPAATHFPPGYPATLALLWTLFPRFPGNVVVFKIASACFLAAAAAFTAIFARRRLGLAPWTAALVALAGTASVPALVLDSQVMSEPLFLGLLIPTLLFAEHVADDDRGVAEIVALGVVVGLVTLVRSHGVAIVGSVGVVLLLRRRIRDAALFAASVLAALLPWQLWVHAHRDAVPPPMGGSYQPYATWLMNGFHESGPALVVRTIAGTGKEIGRMFSIMAAPSLPRAIQLVAMSIVLLLCAIGLRRLWRGAAVTAGFVVLYLAIVMMWPFSPTRFVWGIWPLVVLLPVLGTLEIVDWRPSPRAHRGAALVRIAAIACACLVALGFGRYNATGYRGRWWSSIARNNATAARPLVQWVTANTATTAVISSDAEPMIYLYGHRQAVPASSFTVRDYFRSPTSIESATALRDILRVFHVDVVAVLAPDSLRAALRTMSSERAPELALVDSLPNGLIYTPTHR